MSFRPLCFFLPIIFLFFNKDERFLNTLGFYFLLLFITFSQMTGFGSFTILMLAQVGLRGLAFRYMIIIFFKVDISETPRGANGELGKKF